LQDATRENKLRLLMILAAIYPEKFEGEEGHNIMKVFFIVSVLVFNFLYCFEVNEQSFCLPSWFDIIKNIFHAYHN